MALRPEDIRALAVLSRLAANLGLEVVIVGANVPWILAGPREGLRLTRDVDAVVAVSTWPLFEALQTQLVEAGFAFRRPHRFESPEGARLDLIPFGPGVVRDGRILWPTGERMNALGLEEALRSTVRRALDEGLEVEVASEPAYALLKMVAYEERRHERPHDVADLLILLESYEEEGDRRYLLGDRAVEGRAVTWEEAGAYLLGVDVRRIARPESIEVVVGLLNGIADEYAPPIYHALRESGRPVTDERRQQAFRLFRVLRAGVMSS